MTVNKFIAAAIGAVLVAIANGVLPADTSHYLDIAVAFLTAIGVYAIPNKPA